MFDLACGLVAAGIVDGERGDVLCNPDVGAGGNLLVAVDFLLLVAPVREGCGVSPHGNLAWEVNQLEVAGDGLELLASLAVLNANLKEGVVLAAAVSIFCGYSGELLVGGEVRRGNIMREQDGIGGHVLEADKGIVENVDTSLLIVAGGDNLPVVVGVVEGVAGNLLALAGDTAIFVAERVFVGVAVEVGLGLLVANGEDVIVLDIVGAGEHDVVAESLLEFGGHEVVTGAGAAEDGEVDLEPEEVEEEWHDDQAEGTGTEVLGIDGQAQSATGTLDVQKLPEIDDDGGADGDKGKGTDVLGGHVAGEGKAGKDEPLPPLAAKGLVALLVKLDVAQQAAGHGEDESGIEEDEAGLADVGVVEKDENGGDEAGGDTVARLPHDEVGDGDGQGTEDGGESTEGDVGDLVVNVGVANVFKLEVAVVANEPAHEGEEELGKRGVNIEEVGSLEIVGSKLQRLVFLRLGVVCRGFGTLPK